MTPGGGYPLTPGTRPLTPGGLPAAGRPLLPPRFEVLSELGRGGHGVVLRALDRASGRELAVKVLTGRASEVRVQRFAREAELSRKLTHPGIVSLVDADVSANPPWLAFDFVPGAESLDRRAGGLERRERLEVLQRVARCVGYAHSQGVVHRDLKPSNVLVDPQQRVFLIDFGVATGEENERLTLSGAWVGTPYYMSPEQLRGRTAASVGPAADVWALGVMLYEILTERRPYPGPGVLELAEQVAQGAPRPPRKLDPSLDPRFDALCMRALVRDPAGRFADGTALADALEIVLLGGERPPSAARRLGVAGVLGGALLVGVGFWAAGRGEHAGPEAETAQASTSPSEVAPTTEGARSTPTPAASAPTPAGEADLQQLASASEADLRRGAEDGELAAMHVLAQRFLERGKLAEGIEWRTRAAEGDFLPAITALAGDYYTGRAGLPRDLAATARWMRRACELGDLASLSNYGVLLSKGQGVTKHEAAAIECFRRAAEGGDALGARIYGHRLLEGDGVPQDERAGLRYLRASVEAGDGTACELLGVAHEHGKAGLRRDTAEAARLYDLAAQRGRAEGHWQWARLARAGALGREAQTRWVERARAGAAQGEPQSMDLLALALWAGIEGAERDRPRALQLWERASEAGIAAAKHRLGLALSDPSSPRQDPARSRRLFGEAIAAGYDLSLHALAVLLRTGRGGPVDLAGAAKLERRAAVEGNDPDGMAGYGMQLLRGRGVPRDVAEAERWLRKASERGHDTATRELALILLRRGDSQAGLQLLEQRAAVDDGHACALLAAALRGAVGKVPQDPERSHRFAKRAARLDSKLGLLYEGDDHFHGQVVPRDLPRALQLWTRAAEKGENNAFHRLGQVYLNGGAGVPKDLARARKWLERGVAAGDARCQRLLRQLEAR